ncbi:MAG TPA: FmdE family protein [Bacteroidota bacterium]|nr:FmdE family protein [Bacteroidota bacterium]
MTTHKSTVQETTIEVIKEFHGHICPGLALGFRMAKAAMEALGCSRADDEELTAVVENDACGVDALQVITGCTMGKGNLFFKDYGKMSFTIMKRNTGEAVRVTPSQEQNKRRSKSSMSPEDRQAMTDWILSAPVSDVVAVQKISLEAQPYARIRKSVDCSRCHEAVMESRIRVHAGNYVCIPCAEILERQPQPPKQ